jgi:hypothetical protein
MAFEQIEPEMARREFERRLQRGRDSCQRSTIIVPAREGRLPQLVDTELSSSSIVI